MSTDPSNPEMPSASASAPDTTAPSTSGPTSDAAANQSFHSASLYVGDLANEVNEGLLFEIFNAVGPVSSIRVCRDAVTRRSLGYAYVNFHQMADAERALDTMNFSDINAKPCRIMWSQRDPSLRRSGVGNIFVKNLNESIDNKQLYDTFSLFGNILSCKVVTDRESGSSKGYGYVHYETAEAAHAAIEKLDGMLIDGQEVQVGEFMSRSTRPGQSDFTNLYVKNIPYEWDDDKLNEEFSKFGEVVSAVVTVGIRNKRRAKKAAVAKEEANNDAEPTPAESKEGDDKEVEETIPAADADKEVEAEETTEVAEPEEEKKRVSLGFGFVNFVEHDAAVIAIEELNRKELETIIDGETIKQELYVGRAQKKSERERELRAKFEAEKMDRISKFQGVNLYVKNLDENVTDDMLRDEFATMGTITSARVMKDLKTDRSKGFGFVCYSTPEEATRSVNEMNGKLIGNKPIFVALAQRKEVRRAQLEAQHQRGSGSGPGNSMMRSGNMGPMYPNMGPMYRPGPGGSMQPAYPMMPQMMGGPGRGGPGRGGYPMMQQPRGGYPMPGYQGLPGRGGRIPGRGGRGGRGPQGGQGAQAGIKFNPQARNAGAGMPATNMPQQSPAPPVQSQPAPVPTPAPHEPLTAAALASATPEVQKNMIGERLYPLIHNAEPDLAGKITGMLLEMDNSELLHLLESPDALGSKISEALQVLEAHNQSSD
mmetsp:Transcript_19518/g.28495  ORF Transcript_19518/g.28495 Transcript_19518/m.28495 type:complete len:710 (+) Transcript_19518:230-2359(+)|eukprot:CAMPEP_0197247248 /NCGR_PEP_ID=MMETSP1429-20130617/27297_1 /TAXON_ID=49237 /ORGANISM="Chaetoceros  sp., Strain UNC1202" /LENGTH=709 /DNA_ID=CAMNT_0042708109 /DNA_START=229 /DNA_END=2358 /DNA_ORIENTATION=+